jgi:drug/metabolite transporter (DMT)-like permease
MKLSPTATTYLATCALVYCAAVWGSTFYIVKEAVERLDPLLLVGYRFTLAGLVLLPLAVAQARRPPLGTGTARQETWAEVGAGALLGLILWALYASQTAGLVYTTAANSGFITGLFIVFVPFMNWLLFGRRPGAWQVLAVGIACIGLALLTGGLTGLNAGDALTLIAAATYAWHVLLSDRYARRGMSAIVLCCVQMGLTGALGLAAALLLGARPVVPDAALLEQILFLTAVPTLSAFLLQLWAQSRVPPLRVALIFLLEPVFGAGFAWTLGGEPFAWVQALGGLVIIGAMLLAEIAPQHRVPQPAG